MIGDDVRPDGVIMEQCGYGSVSTATSSVRCRRFRQPKPIAPATGDAEAEERQRR